jgi:hypothetical protein
MKFFGMTLVLKQFVPFGSLMTKWMHEHEFSSFKDEIDKTFLVGL